MGSSPPRQEAQDAENRKKLELKSKRNRPALIENITVSEFMPTFLEHRISSCQPVTANREQLRSHAILKHFQNKKLTDISTGDIHDYVAQRQEDGLQSRSVNLEITFLRSFFKYAIECNYAEFNPANEVTNLKVPKDEHWIPSQEELLKFIEEAARTPSATVFIPWIWFMAYVGTRPTESTHVEWSDIDFEAGQIHIRPKPGHNLKNSKFRVVEMHPELKPILLKWKADWEKIFEARRERHPEEETFPHNWVFFNSHNQDERIRRFTKSFNLARDNSGLPKMTPHTLRHFFISYCVMSGINFFTIAKWVGHRNTKMIEETYGHLSPEFRKKQMGQLKIFGREGENNVAPSASISLSFSTGSPTKSPTEPVLASMKAKKIALEVVDD